jgi:outer membrane receptor protein involved in Fe transport
VKRFLHGLSFICACTLALLLPSTSPAKDTLQKEKEDELDDELTELDDADFPDLVGIDETGEIMDEFAFLQDAGMVESSARHRQRIGMSPSAITVITREDIETSGASTIPDLLRLVPGMDVMVVSPALTAITGRLNWTWEGHHFLVLVDGREANMELMGMVNWEIQPFTLSDIERIEIIRGPGSCLYGANALGGVVSITTKLVPEETSAWMGVHSGEVGYVGTSARVSTRLGNWGFSLSGSGNLSGTFSDHRTMGLQSWRLRSVAEYRWSDKERLMIDGGLARGSGSISTALSGGNGHMTMGNVRLGYRSKDVRGQLYWVGADTTFDLSSDLQYSGISLATLVPISVLGNVLDAEAQWTLPELLERLLFIIGGRGRFSTVTSNQLLDGDTFTDITSARYHEPGVDHQEGRVGAFVHGEFAAFDWFTISGSLGFDYTTQTGEFISPRVAAVFQPAQGQFLRLGASRAFRKPSFMEMDAHMMVSFPDDSPITGSGQDQFQEFMTRVLGNPDLLNENLWSLEVGYLGNFLHETLQISLDLYYNLYGNETTFISNIVSDDQGLPDMEESYVRNISDPQVMVIAGGEMFLRYSPTEYLSFLASWSHREVVNRDHDESPKNLITLGGRFRTKWGLLGSLYAFLRSEFRDRWVTNPGGILEPFIVDHLDNVVLVIGKLGWRWVLPKNVGMEVGIKLFLPISPFSKPYFRFRERGGGFDSKGVNFGGDQLRRMITGYLEGSF